jgi:hypothetical protein
MTFCDRGYLFDNVGTSAFTQGSERGRGQTDVAEKIYSVADGVSACAGKLVPVDEFERDVVPSCIR